MSLMAKCEMESEFLQNDACQVARLSYRLLLISTFTDSSHSVANHAILLSSLSLIAVANFNDKTLSIHD